MKQNLSIVLFGFLLMIGSCRSLEKQSTSDDQDQLLNNKQSYTFVIAITSEKDFEAEVLQSKIPVIVDFSAVWCSACKNLKPHFDQVAKHFENKYKFVLVDVDKLGTLAHQYTIQGIPTILFFKNGKELNQERRHSGFVSKDRLINIIEKNFGE